MEVLEVISDAEPSADTSAYRVRQAARAVLFDDNGLVAMLFVSAKNYHKLPGGGLDEGESWEEALVREVREETGCRIEINGRVGRIDECRSKWEMLQVSCCYLGQVVSKGQPNFTDKEISQGFELRWLPLDQAIAAVESDLPDGYEGEFVQKRDIVFLRKAKEIVGP